MMKALSVASATLVCVLVLTSCVAPPTKVLQTPERFFSGSTDLTAPIVIDPTTVIVDARPRFEYSVAHIPQSINLQWSDFTEPERPGVLLADLDSIARRLARDGIMPSIHVVVVGTGVKGGDEEGWIAWMLAYLGVSHVQFADLNSLKVRLTNISDEMMVPSVPSWKPELVESLNVTKEEVLKVINQQGTLKPMAFVPGAPASVYRIIDVRDEKDYLGKTGFGAKVRVPNLDTINIPWRSFFDSRMHINSMMAERLAEVGIRTENRVIVVSDDGVASAGVALALRAMNYDKAGNYAGGLKDLLQSHLGL